MIRALLVAWAACLIAAPASAQDRRWEIGAFGGVIAGAPATEGSRTLPPAGGPLVTTSPIFPARETPSWLFGDGASLLNGTLEDFGATARVTPLDRLFAAADPARGAAVGARLRRYLNARWSIEAAVTVMPSVDRSGDFDAAVEETRRTFASAFSALLASGPFTGIGIDSTAASDAGRHRETAATVALNRRWCGWGAFTPYATFGGGLAASSGAARSASLRASYRFSILGQVPIVESDSVTLRVEHPTTFIAVLGGGVARDLSAGWRLNVDARAHIGPDSTRVTVTAHPSSLRGSPAGFAESFTNPAIQFSNDPATGRRTTLSAPALDGVEVFSGGTRARILVTVGVTRRF